MDTTNAETALTILAGNLKSVTDDLLRVEGQGVVELTRAFVKLRVLKDQIDEALKPFNDFYLETKDKRVPQAFELAGVPSVSLEEGFRVTIAHNVRASIKGGQKEAAFEWLRANGLGDIVTETVNSSTLSAVARTMAEENREFDADLFSVAILPTTSVTKTKK